jgi:hypothetical protein
MKHILCECIADHSQIYYERQGMDIKMSSKIGTAKKILHTTLDRMISECILEVKI